MEAPRNKYETFLIADPRLDEEEKNALVERFKTLIESHGSVESLADWGKRKLEYEIDDQTEGWYTLIQFEAPRDFPAELERVYNITEGVLRTLIVALDEKRVKA